MNSSNPQFLNDDGTPNLAEISSTFSRCGPTVAGGLAWLDNTRFNRWPNQYIDGKKHDIPNDPKGTAFPFNGASDCRPMVVDDIINERAAMKTTAFWGAQAQPGSVGTDDEAGGYAVALREHLMFGDEMFFPLVREVELSAQYEEHYGWMMLAPRWRREMGIKRKTVYLASIVAAGQQAMQQQQAGPVPNAATPPPGAQTDGEMQTDTPGLADFPAMIEDPMREAEAVAFAQQWFDDFIKQALPEDMQDRAPTITPARARKIIKDLRTTGEAIVPLPYLARNCPEIVALKPWDEVFIPPELTTENDIVFQVERVHESDLRGREVTDSYAKDWVDKAVKFKGAVSAAPMEVRTQPLGIGGLIGGASSSPVFSAQPTLNNSLIEIVHAVYHGVDDDGIPAVYCTTFHRQISGTGENREDYASHGLVEGVEGELPYAAGVREWWCRSITASRGVCERAHTQQNIIKGVLDSTIDRASITGMPPLNVYESPSGTRYKFGPGTQNYVKMGRDPKFMEMPNGQGAQEMTEVLTTVKTMVDNSYALMSGEVSPQRIQMMQSMATQKFLATWNKVWQQVLNLCRVHMDDQEFADITGAPPGWLDAHREDTACLSCQFHFDVRELDPELNLKRIESMNQIALPNDVMGVINRGAWAAYMVRAILGPRAAKMIVTSVPDASTALKDKAELTTLKLFAGNQPTPLDKMDPTAASLLRLTITNVAANPVYLKSLNDEALQALAQMVKQTPQALLQLVAQAKLQRTPDDRFSGMLLDWLKNLQFVGVTQPNNRQVGRTGVNPTQPGQVAA